MKTSSCLQANVETPAHGYAHVGTDAFVRPAEQRSAALATIQFLCSLSGAMKGTILFAFLLAAIAFTMQSTVAAQTTTWKQIPIPPLPAFKPQQPKRIELSNGMVIFLQEDHELPLIDGSARIRGGSVNEPADKTGLVDLFGEVWRTGGTKSQTGDQLDDFLEVRAAKVETGGGPDSTTISFSCLKGDFEDVFSVFDQLLRSPAFRDDKVDLAKNQAFGGIARRNDEVSGITQRESRKLLYGATSPYARVPEYATIAAVTRADLLAWHKQYVHPNNIILGISGDFDSAKMEARLRQAYESWAKGAAAKPAEVAINPPVPGYYLVNKPDVNQSNIRMVDLGIRRDSPDYYAATVFNEAFAGGFSSRLWAHIRSEKGLAYGVGGGVSASYDHVGSTGLGMGTKSESTVQAIQALYDEVDGLAKNPITEAELNRAKESILNSFVFQFDSPDKVLREKMSYEFYGYPLDTLERYRAGVEAITTADVARIAAKYLHKERMAVLVVGKPEDFDKPLSTLGPVKEIDITIPPPPAEKGQ